MKAKKIETMKNLLRHQASAGKYIIDLTGGKYFHELDGQRTEISEDEFRTQTAGDSKIRMRLGSGEKPDDHDCK